MPASIMRLTALLPPPPMPITLMRAPVIGGSSSMNMFMPLPGGRPSGVIIIFPLSTSIVFAPVKRLCGYFGLCAPGTPISCGLYPVPAGAAAYNILSENTTETIAKSGDESAESARRLAFARRAPRFHIGRAHRDERQPCRGSPRRALDVLDETAEAT